jgi:hypothetical protein
VGAGRSLCSPERLHHKACADDPLALTLPPQPYPRLAVRRFAARERAFAWWLLGCLLHRWAICCTVGQSAAPLRHRGLDCGSVVVISDASRRFWRGHHGGRGTRSKRWCHRLVNPSGHGSSGHGAIRSHGVAVLGARPVVVAGTWLRLGPVMSGAWSWRSVVVAGRGGARGYGGVMAVTGPWLWGGHHGYVRDPGHGDLVMAGWRAVVVPVPE